MYQPNILLIDPLKTQLDGYKAGFSVVQHYLDMERIWRRYVSENRPIHKATEDKIVLVHYSQTYTM